MREPCYTDYPAFGLHAFSVQGTYLSADGATNTIRLYSTTTGATPQMPMYTTELLDCPATSSNWFLRPLRKVGV